MVEKPGFFAKKTWFFNQNTTFFAEKPGFSTEKPGFWRNPSFSSKNGFFDRKPQFFTKKPGFSIEKPGFSTKKLGWFFSVEKPTFSNLVDKPSFRLVRNQVFRSKTEKLGFSIEKNPRLFRFIGHSACNRRMLQIWYYVISNCHFLIPSKHSFFNKHGKNSMFPRIFSWRINCSYCFRAFWTFS